MPLSEARLSQPLPPGKLVQTITWLEMTAPPPDFADPPPDLRFGAPVHLGPETYRALYRAVGERWLWWERLVLDDAELGVILDDPRVEIRLLRIDGETAGYSEIDRRGVDGAGDGMGDGASGGVGEGAVEIAFFGLKPAFAGRGLGRALLQATLCAAWTRDTRRVWLHTCNHDHPAALGLYQRAGFRIVRRETALIDDPRLAGLLPPGAAPHVPLASAEP